MKTLSILLLLFISTFASNAFGENRIKGSGEITTVQREVGTFNELKTSSGIQVILTQGDAKPLTLEMEDNLVQYIETIVRENTLIIKTVSGTNLQATKPMKVFVTVPVLKDIEASSASNVSANGTWKGEEMDIEASSAANVKLDVELTKLDVEASSAARIKLTGNVSRLKAELSSASSLDASGLKARSANLETSSAAKISVSVSDEIKCDASSGSRIEYYGSPRVSNSTSSSGGSVKQKNAVK